MFNTGQDCILIGEEQMVDGTAMVSVRVTGPGTKVTEGWVKLDYLELPETYDVEKIVKHKGKRNTKARKYLVRWVGFSAAHDTWEPKESVIDSGPFAEYASAHDDVTDVESDSGESDSDSEKDSDSDSDSDGDADGDGEPSSEY